MTAPVPTGLTYDDATHTYRVAGVVVPSVTQVLRLAGLVSHAHIPADRREAVLERGTRVHRAAHYLLERDLDWPSIDEADRGYAESCAAFLRVAEFTLTAAEVRLYHAGLRVAGTADALGTWRGRPAVVDWCCGDLEDSRKDLQTACYADAAYPGVTSVRIGVRLRADGALPRLATYRDPRDFRLFACAAAVVHEQLRTGVTRP